MLAYHRAGSASNYVLRFADAAFAAYKPNRKRLLTYPSDMTPTLPVRFCPAHCSHKKIPSRNTVNIPGPGRINSISRGTTRIECMPFNKKTALLSFACNVCSRNRPTLLSTGQLPGVPFTCSSKRRSQSVTPYSCRSLQGKSPVLRLFLFEHNPSTSIFSLQGKIYSFLLFVRKIFRIYRKGQIYLLFFL